MVFAAPAHNLTCAHIIIVCIVVHSTESLLPMSSLCSYIHVCLLFAVMEEEVECQLGRKCHSQSMYLVSLPPGEVCLVSDRQEHCTYSVQAAGQKLWEQLYLQWPWDSAIWDTHR